MIGGHKFDSQAEGKRYRELLLMEKAGEITGIKHHPKFPIIVNGVNICTYIADFEYWVKFMDVSKHPELIIEDVKGIQTPIFRLKQKLMVACHGIDVKVVK